MASEALLDNFGDQASSAALQEGNKRTSKFPPTLADEFAERYEVVKHQANTSTGFSGTLFRARVSRPEEGIVAGELILSFRSTEFLDDAARDVVRSAARALAAIGPRGLRRTVWRANRSPAQGSGRGLAPSSPADGLIAGNVECCGRRPLFGTGCGQDGQRSTGLGRGLEQQHGRWRPS